MPKALLTAQHLTTAPGMEARISGLANHWGVERHLAHGAGHNNADSDLDDWPA